MFTDADRELRSLRIPLTVQDFRLCRQAAAQAGLSVETWILREIRAWLKNSAP